MHNDEFLTIAEAAVTLGVSKDTIRRRIKSGEIRAEKRPSPYGDQYYINPIELTGATKDVEVLEIKRAITPEQLTELLKQAMQDVIAPLHSEIAALKVERADDRAKFIDELKEHDSEVMELIGQMLEEKPKAFIGEAMQAQNEALKNEISVLHESIKAIEARQVERESSHYALVDERLKELFEGAKKGFWSRLFRK